MATEEIEISELELAKELAPDNLIPIESSTDTKATTLQKIKDWLGSFFVGKTGNEEINGIKYFNSDVYIKNRRSLIVNSSNLDNKDLSGWKGDLSLYHTDKNNERVLGIYATQTTKGNVCQLMAYDPTNEGTYRASNLSIVYEKEGYTYATAPSPNVEANNTEIVTCNFLKNLFNTGYAENGYAVVGGVTIQWGIHSATKGESSILLNTPFKTNQYAISILNVGPSTTGYVSYKMYRRHTTQVDIASSEAGDAMWIAIGK